MKKIKVLHVSETFVTGVYTYIKSICEFTSKNPNISTTIIYSPNREGTKDLDFKSDFNKGIMLIPVSMQREVDSAEDYKSLKQLKRHIKSLRPDVMHLHSSKAGVLGRIASKTYPKARVYYTPHGYAFLRKDISGFKQSIFKSIEKYMSRIYGGTTIACGDTEFFYAKLLGKALMVRNGISVDELKNIEIPEPRSLKTLVTLGRISAQKNPKLFNDIAKQFPKLNFIWIGDGELKHELTSKNITVTGWLAREKAISQLATYDAYIQTSLWEGLPFTILEAMALQKPIIATNVIGNKDAVEHKKNGFLCNTFKDFEKSIKRLLDNPSLLKLFGEHSKILSHQKFDRDKNFEDLMKIYLNQSNI